jgi:hypothetical protein
MGNALIIMDKKLLPVLVTLLFLFAAHEPAKAREVMLADFEFGIPSSETSDPVGFRKSDRVRGTRVDEGAEGTKSSALFKIQVPEKSISEKNDLFFQGKVRRMYLATGSPEYKEKGPNALSFWIKPESDSILVNKEERKITFGVWTYHWEFGDDYVGGKSNNGLATDSMMHGYANFGLNESASGKWVNIVLTPSAFKQSRYYYHFYAARGTTDDLKFFPTVRQLQFHFFPEIKKEEQLQIDQLKLIYIKPVAVFKEDFFKAKVSAHAGDVRVPVIIKNPTRRDRKYRVFISSFIGVHRNVLYGAHTLTNGFGAPSGRQGRCSVSQEVTVDWVLLNSLTAMESRSSKSRRRLTYLQDGRGRVNFAIILHLKWLVGIKESGTKNISLLLKEIH